jgi:exodeoxyribonuclease-3
VNGILIGCLYLPNGNPAPGPKFDSKLRWFERLLTRGQLLIDQKIPAVLVGDYNAIPTDFDVYSPERWRDDALFRPEVRSAYQRLLDQGWTDSLRTLHLKERIYTFWKYWRNSYARDAGLRLDHLLVSPMFRRNLNAAGVDREIRGLPNASDHAPVWIELSIGRTNQRSARRRKKASKKVSTKVKVSLWHGLQRACPGWLAPVPCPPDA